MDKELEEVLRRHIDAEELHQQELRRLIEANATTSRDNAQAILGLIHDMEILKSEQQTIKQTVSPVAEFFNGVEQVGRFGRIVRAIVGWVVLVVGTITMAYVVVSDSVSGK